MPKKGKAAMAAAKSRGGAGSSDRIKLQPGERRRLWFLDDLEDIVSYEEHWITDGDKRRPVECPQEEHGSCPLCKSGQKSKYTAFANVMLENDAGEFEYKYLQFGIQFMTEQVEKYFETYGALVDRPYSLQGEAAQFGDVNYTKLSLVPLDKAEQPDEFGEVQTTDWMTVIVTPTPAALEQFV
jgi:hypothetical protein